MVEPNICHPIATATASASWEAIFIGGAGIFFSSLPSYSASLGSSAPILAPVEPIWYPLPCCYCYFRDSCWQ